MQQVGFFLFSDNNGEKRALSGIKFTSNVCFFASTLNKKITEKIKYCLIL